MGSSPKALSRSVINLIAPGDARSDLSGAIASGQISLVPRQTARWPPPRQRRHHVLSRRDLSALRRRRPNHLTHSTWQPDQHRTQ